jgi:hypothetical protein
MNRLRDYIEKSKAAKLALSVYKQCVFARCGLMRRRDLYRLMLGRGFKKRTIANVVLQLSRILNREIVR